MKTAYNADVNLFHWADYLVFVLALVLSASIGIYYGWKDRNKKTAEDFLLAGKNMSPIPVGISIFVSFMSATSFLADPVEVYRYGAVYWYLCVGYCVSIPFVAHYFGPVYHRMQIISIHQYLETRFNKYLRIAVPIVRTLTTLLFVAVVLLGPSLALSQVTNLEVWVSVLIVGLVCTFYTSLGGMKAVLWADTMQCCLMFAGVLAVLIQATIDVGGLGKVWEIAQEGGRINFNKIDPNPLQHATVWTYLVGGFFRTFNAFTATQPPIQRFSSLASERAVTIALYITLPLFLVFGSIFTLTGLVMYAYYHDCDPLLTGRVSQSDQMLPLLTMDVLGFLPGIPGLFIACIFSACMSSLSSYQSGMAAYWLKDFVMPIYKRHTGNSLPSRQGSIISQILSVIFGLLTIGIVFLLLQASDPGLFRLSNLIAGSFGSPIAGIFITGILFSCVENVGIVGGLLISLGLSLWIGIGSYIFPNSEVHLPTSTHGCSSLNSTNITGFEFHDFDTLGSALSSMDHVSAGNSTIGFRVEDLYKLSSMLFFGFGSILTALGAIIISSIVYVISKLRNRKGENYTMKSALDKSTTNEGFTVSKETLPIFEMDSKPTIPDPVLS